QDRLIGSPFGGAEPAALNGVQDAQNLLGAAADAQAVHHLILQDTVGIDEEQAAQGDVLLWNVDAIGSRRLALFVGSERKVQRAEPALRARQAEPLLMRCY